MEIKALPNASRDYLDRLRNILEGRETVPSLKLEYTLDPAVMHCHEAEMCPMRVYLTRITTPPAPPMSDRAILTFMRGRLFERILADELPAMTKDGISGRVDGLWQGELVETKSTTQDMDKFNPATSQPHWLRRSKAYCTLHGRNKLILVVWFLIGNMWTKKMWQPGSTNTGLKCWELEFDDSELRDNWDYMILQREKLFCCVENGIPPDSNWVWSRIGRRSNDVWECGDCRFWDVCLFDKKGAKK